MCRNCTKNRCFDDISLKIDDMIKFYSKWLFVKISLKIDCMLKFHSSRVEILQKIDYCWNFTQNRCLDKISLKIDTVTKFDWKSTHRRDFTWIWCFVEFSLEPIIYRNSLKIDAVTKFDSKCFDEISLKIEV